MTSVSTNESTNAITLTVNKRLSNRFSVLGSYTYSRLLGNYPGPFSPYVNQLDPNISSQYDIIDLTVNRDGALNNDRPHNFKLTGFYVQPLQRIGGALTISLTFTAISGRPIQVLGAHAAYGGRQTLILAPVAALYWVLLHRSVVGRGLFAIGHNPEAARYSGIPVARHLRTVYLLSGLTASLAALVYVARIGQAKSDAGTGYELLAITAVVFLWYFRRKGWL